MALRQDHAEDFDADENSPRSPFRPFRLHGLRMFTHVFCVVNAFVKAFLDGFWLFDGFPMSLKALRVVFRKEEELFGARLLGPERATEGESGVEGLRLEPRDAA